MMTSRVCAHTCQTKCNRCSTDEPVAIHSVERVVGDYILAHADRFYPAPRKETGKKIALVGAGPAGLTAAYYLRAAGHSVTVYEALEEAGIQFDCVLDVEVPDQEILHRMIGRRSCPICGATYHLEAAPPKVEGKCDHCGNTLTQREDDKHETVISRLSTYHAQTEPLKKFYADRGILKVVAFQPSIEATTQRSPEFWGI